MLARCLAEERRFDEAEKLLLEGYPILEKQFGKGHPRVAAAAERAVALYEAWNKPDKAAEWKSTLTTK